VGVTVVGLTQAGRGRFHRGVGVVWHAEFDPAGGSRQEGTWCSLYELQYDTLYKACQCQHMASIKGRRGHSPGPDQGRMLAHGTATGQDRRRLRLAD
jgi:hypothetical protein